MRRAVVERDDGLCVFPGCGRRHDEVHHLKTRGAGGKHEVGNLACLCWEHHRMVHDNPDHKRALLAECRRRGIIVGE